MRYFQNRYRNAGKTVCSKRISEWKEKSAETYGICKNASGREKNQTIYGGTAVIHTSTQLKALVRNKSHGDNAKAMTLIRNFVMERFLERMSLSKYSDKLILKGGLLIASMVGLDNRATMDIDTTIRNDNLSAEDAEKIIADIIAISLDDGTQFAVKSVERIMDEAEYPGIRFKLESALDTMKTPLKIDISTNDVITPKEVN